MIEDTKEYIHPYFSKFSLPEYSRFTKFFEQISNEKTQLSKTEDLKKEQFGKKLENYEIEIEKIKNGDEKRTSLIIKGIPSSFGCMNLYNILKEFCKNINFFYIPGYIYKPNGFMYAFVNVKHPNGVLSIYKCIKILKEKSGIFFGYNLSGIKINYCKTQGYRSLKRKYTNEYFENFLICE